LWQASVNWADGIPTVSGGSVFVTTNSGDLEAFDASGITNCSGSPKVCSPLWTAHISASSAVVTVSGGYAYALGSGNAIVALDATGNAGCSGTPKVCTPLWTYAPTYPVNGGDNTVSVSGTTLYAGTWKALTKTSVVGSLEAFDGNGVNGCSGAPKVCAPIWTSSDIAPSYNPPVVGNGVVFSSPITGPFAAFAANGSSSNPLWTALVSSIPLAIGGSVLYAEAGNTVYAFDVSGQAGCARSVCSPLWSATVGSSSYPSTAIVANGTLYVSSQDTSGNGEVVAYGLP
jgi:hypothetical protein